MRSENIRADIARVSSMSEEEFLAKWGAWCRAQDRDPALMRRRWLEDLEHMLPFAEREEAAVAELVAAKDAYRADPSARARRDAAVAAVQEIRAAERAGRPGLRPAGDAFVTGG